MFRRLTDRNGELFYTSYYYQLSETAGAEPGENNKTSYEVEVFKFKAQRSQKL